MKINELKERLEKAKLNLAKAEKSLEKHEAKLASLKPNTYEYEWEEYEVKHAKNLVEEKANTVKNWEKKIAKAEEQEQSVNEMPIAFLYAKAELVKEWVAYDIAQRERIRAIKNEYYKDANTVTEIREASKKYREVVKYSTEEAYSKTDEEFLRLEEKNATECLIDLYNRVKAITGKITDASNIRWGGKCLDGYIIGEQGTAEVETISAGGYNIQRYHLRTLVKERK